MFLRSPHRQDFMTIHADSVRPIIIVLKLGFIARAVTTDNFPARPTMVTPS
jgi:hypothetical protein